jgi:hypothetical protein
MRDERVDGKVSSDDEAEANDSGDDSKETDAEDENDLDSLGAKGHLAVDDPDGEGEEGNVCGDADNGVRPHHVSLLLLADAFAVWFSGIEEISVFLGVS